MKKDLRSFLVTENNIDAEAKSYLESLKEKNLKKGYFINPDETFSLELVKSLLINKKRYSYESCPCRLATGKLEDDLDIICPCNYRDADVWELGCCFCGLYSNQKIKDGIGVCKSIPERRPSKEERQKMQKEKDQKLAKGELSYPIWRCTVCGYICARDEAPEICPICGVKHDRFEKFVG